MKVFSHNIRKHRLDKGLTQEKLGQLCGLHRTYIGAIERGKRNISIRNVEKIANALNIQAYKLFIDEKH